MVTALLLAEEDFASYIIFACCWLPFLEFGLEVWRSKKKSLNKDASVFLTILLHFFHSHPYGPFPKKKATELEIQPEGREYLSLVSTLL